MTLDEAIERHEWAMKASEGEASEEHRQHTEWFRELKVLRAENDEICRAKRDAMIERDTLKSENASLRGAAMGLGELCDQLEDENAKLKVERDEWHRVAKSKQESIDLMRDVCAENRELKRKLAILKEHGIEIVDATAGGFEVYDEEHKRADALEGENKKLRDLVQMMYACKGECDECQWLNDGYACGYFMEELGIEVDG